MGKFRKWWSKFKDDLAFQKEYSKGILKTKWDIGAEQGKKMKEEHKKMVRRDKDGTQGER